MTMKCKCGNETGQPRVNPYPISFIPHGKKEPVFIYFMGGFNQHGQCWFCAFPYTGWRDG